MFQKIQPDIAFNLKYRKMKNNYIGKKKSKCTQRNNMQSLKQFSLVQSLGSV